MQSPTLKDDSSHFLQKNILFLGSEESGKSTLCGCLECHDDTRYVEKRAYNLYLGIPEHLWPSKEQRVLEAYQSAADHTSRPERAPLIQIGVLHKTDQEKKEILTLMNVSTKKRKLDCLIKACFLADIAVLVVDITDNKFEKEIEKFDSTLNNQLRVAKSFGIQHMIVCLNKCDTETQIQKLHNRYLEIVTCLEIKLRKLGWRNIPFIPVSSVGSAPNVVHNNGAYHFYKGDPLWNTLKNLQITKDSMNLKDKSLKLAPMDIYKIGGVGTVIIARIERGTIRENDTIQSYPKYGSCKNWIVKSLEIAFNPVKRANVGDFVGVALKNCSIRDIKNYYVFNKIHEPLEPMDVESFEATVKIIITPESGEIRVGYTCKMHFMTYKYLCKIEEIMSVRMSETNKTEEQHYPQSAKVGQVIQARIRLLMRFHKFAPLELYSENPRLGRVLLVDKNKLIGVANVTKLNYCKTSFKEDDDIVKNTHQ